MKFSLQNTKDEMVVTVIFLARHPPNNDARNSRKAVLSVQTDIQHDSESFAGRSPQSRGND